MGGDAAPRGVCQCGCYRLAGDAILKNVGFQKDLMLGAPYGLD